MKKGSFKVDIYGFTIQVIIVPDSKDTVEFYKRLRKRLKLKPKKFGACQGFVFNKDFKAWIVFAEDCLSHNLVTHECTHLSMQIVNYNNINVDKDNEYFACLSGYVNEQVFKIINKLGCKIN